MSGPASGPANHLYVDQVWSGKNFACGATNPGGQPPGPPAVRQASQTPNRSPGYKTANPAEFVTEKCDLGSGRQPFFRKNCRGPDVTGAATAPSARGPS